MHALELVLLLLVVAAAMRPIALKVDIPLPIVQALAGLALSPIPYLREMQFDPDLIFAVFVPPILYWAALTSSVRDLRNNARPLILLALLLVLVTIGTVGVAAHMSRAAVPWASAFILGAIVGPPDAQVTTAIARRLGLPSKLVTLLEGETLLNDVTAFVSFNLAVKAVMVGTFSIWLGARNFALVSVGGVALGLAIGWLIAWLRQFIDDPPVENTISLLTPFAVYLPGELIGVSGVLAVVTCGLYLSRAGTRVVSARTRLQARMMWDMITFTIGGIIFTLIGVQLGKFAPYLWKNGDFTLLYAALVVSLTVVVVRIVWVIPAAYLPRMLSKSIRDEDPNFSWRNVAIVGWTGMRGGDTLVTALAIPFVTLSGKPFPARQEIIVLAFGVIGATLILQGLTLRPFIKWLEFPKDDRINEEERVARNAATSAAFKRLDAIAKRDNVPAKLIESIRGSIKQRAALDLDEIDHADGHDGKSHADILRDVEQETRAASREAVIRLRDENTIGDEAMRRVQFDLDLDEVRISELSPDDTMDGAEDPSKEPSA